MKRTMKRGLLAAVCFVSGLIVSGWGLGIILEGRASENWPTVTGEIISSEIAQRSGGNNSGYDARVTYEYTVDGAAYRHDRVAFTDAVAKTRSHAQEIAERYPAGEETTVYYDADDPQSATLEPGVSGASYLPLLFGGALLVGALVASLRFLRSLGA